MSARPASPGTMFGDPSLWGVIAGNVLSMALAIAQQWPINEIMWIYWQQSVIIGATNFLRMWRLKEFSTEGFTMNDRRIPETEAGARSTAIFFVVHYGFFHFVYAIFLASMASAPGARASSLLDTVLAAVAVLGFLASHLYSLRHNEGRDFRAKKPNLGALMFYPYLRIIPMHLTIIVGGAVAGLSLGVFMALKTLADCGMHIVEHRLFQAPARAAP